MLRNRARTAGSRGGFDRIGFTGPTAARLKEQGSSCGGSQPPRPPKVGGSGSVVVVECLFGKSQTFHVP